MINDTPPQPEQDIEVETEVVELNGEYIVKLYANFGTMKMHVANMGPLATRELADDLAEHMKQEEKKPDD